jgi:hypothetical protein
MFYICSEPASQPIVDLNRGVSVAGIAAREGLTQQRESAGKWRRHDLKGLNPGLETVWARKPRTHKMWNRGARLTVRDSG